MNQASGPVARALAGCILLVCAGSMFACKGDSGTRSDEQPSDPAPVDEIGGQAPDPSPDDTSGPLTPEAYERLLLGLAACEIRNEHIDARCPAKKAFQDARKRAGSIEDFSGLVARLGRAHIGHQSPAVRIQAAAFLTSIFGTDPSTHEVLVRAARAEKEPAVLVSMIQAVGAKGAENPEIGALLLEMADHPSAAVRKKAVIWLGSSWNAALEGSLDKLIDRIENDPDGEVRRFACKYAGDRGDDRMVPVYAKYTADPTADPKLYAACMEGLMNSWLHYPRFHTHNRKAYELTIERLGHTPRSQDAPPWTLMDNFAELANETNKKVEEWRETTRAWFKPKDVLAVLEDVVMDPKAYRLARTGALKSMVALGVSDKTLARIRRAHADSHDSGATELLEEIDKAVAARSQKPATQ